MLTTGQLAAAIAAARGLLGRAHTLRRNDRVGGGGRQGDGDDGGVENVQETLGGCGDCHGDNSYGMTATRGCEWGARSPLAVSRQVKRSPGLRAESRATTAMC